MKDEEKTKEQLSELKQLRDRAGKLEAQHDAKN
jgi:hypothetical protein